jgi:hypothetical protein
MDFVGQRAGASKQFKNNDESKATECTMSSARASPAPRLFGECANTVKVHRARVMEKMKGDLLADLVRLAERVGIARANRNIKTGEPTPPVA